MKKKIMFVGCLLSTMALAGFAYAGYVGQVDVTMNESGAFGTILGARNSPGPDNYIGCYVAAYSSGYESGACFASNGSTYRSCLAGNAAQRDAIRSIGLNTYIWFTTRSDGTCDSLFVQNASFYAP